MVTEQLHVDVTPPGAAEAASTYDGFISYSHAVDGKLAPAIQHALHTLAKPWYRLRALHVFRDETSLSADPNLWSSIEKALSQSRWFIYLASPRATESEWVRKEIDWWLSHHGPSSMLIALTEGTLRWSDNGSDFDWSATDAFPREFAGRLAGEPLWVDLSWAHQADNLSLRHSQFRAAVLRLASPMHARPPDELDGDDVRQHRRNRLTAKAAIVALLVLTTVSLAAAYLAVRRSRESISRELAMHSLQQLEIDPELSLRLALHAADSAGTIQAEEALRRALRESRVLSTFGTPGQASTAKYSSTGRTILIVSGREAALWKQESGEIRILRNTAMISQAEFSHDGTLVATGGWDGKARVWDVATARLVSEWQAVEAMPGASPTEPTVKHLAFSPSAELLLTSGGSPGDPVAHVARLWDVKTTKRMSELKGHTADIATFGFAADGKRVVTGGWDGTARIWDVATGTLLKTLTGHLDMVFAVAFSPDGARVVSASLDLTVRSWNIATGAVQAISGRPEKVGAPMSLHRIVSISPSTRRALTHGVSSTTIYDPQTGAALRELTDFPSSCSKAVFSTDDRLVACPGQEGAAFVWDVETGQRIEAFRGHRGELNDLSFSPDGRVLLTAGTDNTVREWSVDRTTADLILIGHGRAVQTVTWSPDGALVATGSDDEAARVWDARTGGLVSKLPTPVSEMAQANVVSLAFSADSQRLLVSSFGIGGAHVWDARAGTLSASLDTNEMAPTISDEGDWTANDGIIILGAAEDPVLLRVRRVLPPLDASNPSTVNPILRGDLLRWDANSGRALSPIPAGKGSSQSGRVTCGQSRAANLVCLVTDEDTTSRIWDVRSGSMIAEIKGHMPNVATAIMSTDGRHLAFSDGTRVEIWDARLGKLESQIPARANYTITGLDFDLSGRRLVTAGGQLDPVARVWDTVSGRLLLELRGHTHTINRARFSPDGRLIVTASQDNSARVWSLEDARDIMVLRGHRDMLFDARFSPDGRRVLTAGADGTARIFDASLAKPLRDLLQIAQQRRTRELTAQEVSMFLH